MIDALGGPHVASWIVAALAIAGVILRPFGWPEAVWAVAGAALLVALGLLPLADAAQGVARGTDVYLFLTGMMLLAELARQEGLFDWLAARALRAAHGSAGKLFALVYGVGIVVTVFLSNDATAVVLTPAVAVVAKAARAERPLPYLFACAFIANAASFVLPISNPANLVIYGSHMPPLLEFLPRYALPSAAAIAATFAVLWLTQRKVLAQAIEAEIEQPHLPPAARIAAAGIVATALALMAASAWDIQLGWPTCLAGGLTVAIVLIVKRASPWSTVKDISWGVLPLVGGLFVLVQSLGHTGVLDELTHLLRDLARRSPAQAAWGVGLVLAMADNLLNNLPCGLIGGAAVQAAQVPPAVTGAVLIGVDLGPNLSVTGSLATILWLGALRREGIAVSAWSFLKLGALVMPPALLLALGALQLTG